MAKGRKTGGKDFSSKNQPQKRGRKPLPKDLREANTLTKARLQGMINKYLWLTLPQLTVALQSPETPMIEKVVGSIIHKALVEGDDRRFGFILDRMIGRVKEELDIKTFSDRVNALPDSEIIEIGEKATAFLKAVPD